MRKIERHLRELCGDQWELSVANNGHYRLTHIKTGASVPASNTPSSVEYCLKAVRRSMRRALESAA